MTSFITPGLTTATTSTWLTPPGIINALEYHGQQFDLDPCAAPEPRPWPTARNHYALPQDGLALPWHGRIWLNPPYGAQTWPWVERLAEHGYGTALLFARTDVAGFQRHVFARALGILFLAGRLNFHYPDGTRAEMNGGAASCLVAYGGRDFAALASSGLRGKLVRL